MTQPPLIAAPTWFAGRSVADPRISPDGSHVAFVASNGDRSELAVVPVGGGAERWLPVEPSVRSISSSGGGAIAWSADGSIVYVAPDGQVRAFDPSTGEGRAITSEADAVSTVVASPEGSRVAYVRDVQDVAVVPVEDRPSWPVRRSSGADFAFDVVWSPDGEWLAWHEWDVPDMPWDGGRIAVRRADGSAPVVTVAGGAGIAVQQPRFSPDGSRLAFLSDERGWMNVWAVDVADVAAGAPRPEPLLEEVFEHGGPAWGPGQRSYCWARGGESLVVCRNVAGRGELVEHHIPTGTTTDLGHGTYGGLDAHGETVVGVVTDVHRPAEIERLVLGAPGAGVRERVVLARGAVDGLGRGLPEPEQVSWSSSDGTTVPARLYRTTNPRHHREGRPPLLVWVHGGPHGQSPATFLAFWGYFLQRGWSVLVPDFRGSSGWGRAHLQALEARWGHVDVDDVASGMRVAGERGWGDPDRLVPVGGSAGGTTVLWLLQQYPALCAAGVTRFPVVDLIGLNEDTWRFEAHYLQRLVGPLPAAYDSYVDRSPLTHAGEIDAPLLTLHGDADKVVPQGQSAALAAAVRRSGGVVEEHVYEGEGHGWRRPATKIDELERVESFLRRHVLHEGPETGEGR